MDKSKTVSLLLLFVVIVLLVGCATPAPAPTATPIPPMATPVPPTATRVPPTATAVPPTAVSVSSAATATRPPAAATVASSASNPAQALAAKKLATEIFADSFERGTVGDFPDDWNILERDNHTTNKSGPRVADVSTLKGPDAAPLWYSSHPIEGGVAHASPSISAPVA